MGRKPVKKTEYVESKSSREQTYSKRKRNILKQCIELSKMCGQDICLTIFDKLRQRYVLYCSSDEFTPMITANLLSPENHPYIYVQSYTNENYQQLVQGREMKGQDSADSVEE
jgi:hypothetical protein